MNLGRAIQTVRKGKGLRQEDLSRLSGLSQTYISQIEKNKKEPKISSLLKISEVYEVPLPILFFLALDESDMPSQKREMFHLMAEPVKSFIQEFFLQNTEPSSHD